MTAETSLPTATCGTAGLGNTLWETLPFGVEVSLSGSLACPLVAKVFNPSSVGATLGSSNRSQRATQRVGHPLLGPGGWSPQFHPLSGGSLRGDKACLGSVLERLLPSWQEVPGCGAFRPWTQLYSSWSFLFDLHPT